MTTSNVVGTPVNSRPAYILFLAAPLFALFTGFSRLNRARCRDISSRHLFFAISMMLPLTALGLTSLVRRLRLRVVAVVVLTAILVVYNLGGRSAACSSDRGAPIRRENGSRPVSCWCPTIRVPRAGPRGIPEERLAHVGPLRRSQS